jgi:hypothetical protein
MEIIVKNNDYEISYTPYETKFSKDISYSEFDDIIDSLKTFRRELKWKQIKEDIEKRDREYPMKKAGYLTFMKQFIK